MTLDLLLRELRGDDHFMANVMAWRTVHAKPAQNRPIPDQLHARLVDGLQQRGIHRLYTHQAEAVALALDGVHIAVVTPTASGKTLCYNLPVLHALLQDPQARALYLFPTKALAHDQLDELLGWEHALAATGPSSDPGLMLNAAPYDGDTPSAQRAQIRRSARILLSNPDMLHTGILPYHANWEAFFGHLRFVVLDEMHTYRGVFGSHVANVLRRLRRICAFYGSRPQFISTSATIANPGQLAEGLIEEPVSVIEENGAPQGEKHIILYNPPIVDQERGLRRSSTLETRDLAARAVLGGVQTIVFGRSRLTTELLLTYLRDRLNRVPGPQPLPVEQMVRGYRGGYLPTERRAIEAGLRDGLVRGVVATNALELGIDIGQLQAALLCGYPGSIASTWQQMGRAGRSVDAALAILVATGGVLDQYIIRHPEFIFERSPENALINADNLMLLVDQMRCAAFELPFQRQERFGNSPFAADVLALIAEQGDLHLQNDHYYWAGLAYPARSISLRSAGSDTVTIQTGTIQTGTIQTDLAAPDVDSQPSPSVIGEIDHSSAPMLIHDGAIYIHEGQSYVVESLDLSENLAQVRAADVDFYTNAMSETEITVLAQHEKRSTPATLSAHGDLQVTNQVVGYRRIKRISHETLGIFPLDYPPQEIETTGYWLSITRATQAALEVAGQWRDSVNDYGPNWQAQRERVRRRDGYRCRQCGAPEPTGRQHDVHHLVPFRTFGYVQGLNDQYLRANQLDNLLLVCRTCHQRLEAAVRVRSGLDGLAYAINNLAPLYLMCDHDDIGVHIMRGAAGRHDEPGGNNGQVERARQGHHAVSDEMQPPKEEETASNIALPTIYIYERIVAGLGFSVRLFELHDRLLDAARQLVRDCPCPLGCPACVGPVAEEGEIRLDTKGLTLALLDEIVAPGAARASSRSHRQPNQDVQF